MTAATMDRGRRFVLPILDSRRVVAHIFKHDTAVPANIWFSVRDTQNEEPQEPDDHESDLLLGFEADVSEATAQEIDRVAKSKETLEHQEEIITKAFFETVMGSRDRREQLRKSYPQWTASLLAYLNSKADEVKTEFYFQLDRRLGS